jgi:arogenate/prephenate dehydratase
LTRFVVLSRDPVLAGTGNSEDYKTSILFSLEEGPGVLFKALSVFALRDIDLTKIESRPLRTNPMVLEEEVLPTRFNYLFYVDFIGSLNEVKCQNALRHLQEFAPFVRVLGSYPRYKSPV